ncbi:MAG TPA: HAD family hydrolase [Gammaproteobacteria bacterium]|nr:HAD family hydrolase [Gammaproteobacteria bacterium]
MSKIPKTIKIVSFDLDDTLWPCMQTIMHAEEQLMQWLASRARQLTEAHTIHSMREHRRQLAISEPAISHDLNLLRETQLRQLLLEFGHDPGIAAQAVDYFQQFRNLVYPYPDVLPALTRLKAEYLLVSVTNGTTELEKTPLKGIFHHSINAKQAGHAKPHPALFERVVEITGNNPNQVLHIGDDPLRDVESARNFGLHALWLNRHAMPWPDDIERAEIEIFSLSELQG